jgi:hypothetical protein
MSALLAPHLARALDPATIGMEWVAWQEDVLAGEGNRTLVTSLGIW